MHTFMMDKDDVWFFKKSEIRSLEKFYGFIDRKKIAVFVPLNFVQKLSEAMFAAGAGVIGNYEMCSFRTKGVGTFKPVKNARPFAGKKDIVSFEEEVRLEMEVEPGKLNPVIDALLNNHPYEEKVYEIYDFKRRDKDSIGNIYNLKKGTTMSELMTKLNKSIQPEETYSDYIIKRIAVINKVPDRKIKESAGFTECDCLISKANKKIKIIKI